jgi:translocation and assembly module TamA
VTSLYGRRGHRQAGVRLSTAIDRANQAVKLAIAVDEGVREVVAEVASGGEDVITSPKMVARAMQVSPGQPVDSHAIEEAQRKLYDLGVFRSVEPRFEPAGDPATAGDGGVTQPVKVVFDLQEYPRYRLRYGFQVATGAVSSQEIVDSGPRPGGTVDLRRSNLFGRAVDASAGAFVSTDRYRLRGLLTSTTLAGRPVQSTLSVTREHREQTTADYVESASRTLISAEQRWRPIRRVEFAYGYELDYQDREIAIVPLAAGEAFSFPLSARIASVFGTWTYDSRDNVLNPTKGMFHSANVETGTSWLASEIGYAQYLGQHFFYVPAGRATWASGIRFGSVGILDEQEESIEATLVRFRTGGGTTVRGYRQDDLTPRYVGRIYRGGDVLLVLNQEVRVPLWSWLGAVGFVDAGNAFREWGDFSLGDLQVGVGAGLRLVSPFGVVRLDLGFPRPRPSNYPLALWYFSFGHAF